MKPAGTPNKHTWIFRSTQICAHGLAHRCIPLLTTHPHSSTWEQADPRCRHAHRHALPFVITTLLHCEWMEIGEACSVFHLKGKKKKTTTKNPWKQTKLSEQLFFYATRPDPSGWDGGGKGIGRKRERGRTSSWLDGSSHPFPFLALPRHVRARSQDKSKAQELADRQHHLLGV